MALQVGGPVACDSSFHVFCITVAVPSGCGFDSILRTFFSDDPVLDTYRVITGFLHVLFVELHLVNNGLMQKRSTM